MWDGKGLKYVHKEVTYGSHRVLSRVCRWDGLPYLTKVKAPKHDFSVFLNIYLAVQSSKDCEVLPEHINMRL